MRRAKQKQAGALGDGPLQSLQVCFPTAIAQDQGHLHQSAVRKHGRRHERRVDRSEGDHLVSRFADRPAENVQAGDQSREPDYPLRTDLPAVVRQQRSLDGRYQFGGSKRVSKDPVGNPLVQGLDDRGGGAKVHIGHPEWYDVTSLILAPLAAIGHVTVDNSVEVEPRRVTHWHPRARSSFQRGR